MPFINSTKYHEMDSYSAYCVTDNFLSPISLSDLLILCSKNWILYKKKKWKWKNKFVDDKRKQCQKILCKEKKHSLLWTHPTDPCSKLLRHEGNMGDKKLSVKHPFW